MIRRNQQITQATFERMLPIIHRLERERGERVTFSEAVDYLLDQLGTQTEFWSDVTLNFRPNAAPTDSIAGIHHDPAIDERTRKAFQP
jgi:hypothetical protein